MPVGKCLWYILLGTVSFVLISGFLISLATYRIGCPHFVDVSCNLTQCFPDYCRYSIYSDYKDHDELCLKNMLCYITPNYGNITVNCSQVNTTIGNACYGDWTGNRDVCHPNCFNTLAAVFLILTSFIGMVLIIVLLVIYLVKPANNEEYSPIGDPRYEDRWLINDWIFKPLKV